MARIDKKSRTLVSLFPFLSILACVMGTLTLIIYGVALGQNQDEPFPETYQKVNDKITQTTTEIERLKALIARALERERQISDLRDEITRLEALLPGTLEQKKLAAILLPQHEELIRQIKALEEQLGQSTIQLNDLNNQINITEEELNKLELVRSTNLMTVLNQSFNKYTSDTLTLYPSANANFNNFVSWTKGQPERCVGFLSLYRLARFEESQLLAKKPDIQYCFFLLLSDWSNLSEHSRKPRATSKYVKGVALC